MDDRSFHHNNRAACLNENRLDQRPPSTAHHLPHQEQPVQYEAPQWQVNYGAWGQSGGWLRQHGPAIRQDREPSAWQQWREPDDRWSAAGSTRGQKRHGFSYDYGLCEEVYSLGQPAFSPYDAIHTAPYSQRHLQRETARHHHEHPGYAQAPEQKDQTWYAQYPQHEFYHSAAHQQNLMPSYDGVYGGRGLTQTWQTVNDRYANSTDTNGFTAINLPALQQGNSPSVPAVPQGEHCQADRNSYASSGQNISHNLDIVNAQYKGDQNILPPQPRAPRMTKNQRKKLLAQEQSLPQPLPPLDLNQGQVNRTTRSRASLSPKPPRRQAVPRPEPKRYYMQQANEPLLPLDFPRPLLIILDLNGTLLHRNHKGSSFTARPRVNEFLRYLLTTHAVMVWSSAQKDNVQKMCEQLFTKQQIEQLIGIWARDKLRLGVYAKERVQVYKQLSWVWEELAAEGSEAWDQSNTVLIDDSLEKAASEPHNLIEIEEFENRVDQQQTDVLGQVVRYLEVARTYSDVSSFMREYPFTYLPDDSPFNWKEIMKERH